MRLRSLLAAVPLMAAASLCQADVAAGQSRAQVACAVCHGQQGLSTQPHVPHLAGQPSLYLAEQLRHYRSGKRHHELMSVIARPLTDEDIRNLSAWYASLTISVEEK